MLIFEMGRVTGIEPARAGATIRSVNRFTTHAMKIYVMAGVIGFEPISTVLETAALPLNYTPKTKLLIYYIIIYFKNQGF